MIAEVLDLLRKGLSPGEVAERLGATRDEVDGAIAVLSSLGYVEKFEKAPCQSCPLKGLCNLEHPRVAPLPHTRED
ncbi:hypothetical protein [Thermococcus eurythermalis]|uniref:hypothetical protein n=1 Tax=Thermococcus eurythermalis TaxID=1505907 RepID=UPI000679CBE3|nr:hypothetical protein [Thermococcus eurythermalis]